jgi:YVTN family beta-propeller protein
MVMRPVSPRLALALLGLRGLAGIAIVASLSPAEEAPASEPHRSPVALALSADGSRLLTANQTAGSVSLIDARNGKVLHEVPTGDRPAGVALAKDGRRGVVTHWYGYDLAILDVTTDRLAVIGRVEVGPEPRGVVLSGDGRTAYVAVGASNEVVRVDLDEKKVTGRLSVGREPRGIAIAPDGARLLVGNARSRDMSVIATAEWKVERTVPMEGENLRQVAIDAEGRYGYVANMRNRGFATTKDNIDRGWVLGQRVTRAPLDGSEEQSNISLDPQGKATADVHGVAVGADGRHLAVSSGGTHEVLLFRTDQKRLPWRIAGNRDLIPGELLQKDGRFRRVSVGGRPTELAFAADGKTLYVANYLADAVQIVDAESGELAKTIPLGGPSEPSLVRRGEMLFHDATRSFNQWYSCNTCHSDGHTNGLDFDTMNDGWQDFSTAHLRSRKKVPTLRRVAETGPWTWHGWQKSLEDAAFESFTKSMQGARPSGDDVKAVAAYLGTLDFPRNPHRGPDGSLSAGARRGEAVYRSPKAACNNCHGGPELSDGRVHVVGLEERGDVYKGYNPPSLRGVYDKDPYLHDGRAATLREALTKGHNPDDVTGLGEISDEEMNDLIAYLKSL